MPIERETDKQTHKRTENEWQIVCVCEREREWEIEREGER